MIVSFSIPEMLPAIWEGLREIDGKPRTLPCLHDRATKAWLRDTIVAAGAHRASPTHVKRQTIRRFSSHWLRLVDNPLAYNLHLYWKSRHPTERRFLAEVPCQQAYLITIERHSQGEGFDVQVEDDKRPLPLEYMATLFLHDGFKSGRAFRDYFVPQPGDRFAGVLIRW